MSENSNIYLVHIRTLVSVYHINTDKCTHILLNHQFINTIPNSNTFQPLKCLLQRAGWVNKTITSCKIQLSVKSVSNSFYVTQYTLHTQFSFKTCDSIFWPMLLECINYTPWRWLCKGLNMLGLRRVLIKWWFSNTRVHLLVFIWCRKLTNFKTFVTLPAICPYIYYTKLPQQRYIFFCILNGVFFKFSYIFSYIFKWC